MSTPDFPEGFQGAGPMFAAVDLGDPWYNMAKLGEVTYVAENADVQGRSAFLERADAEAVADASTAGEFTRWQGLSGWNEVTPARAEAERQAEDMAWGGRTPSASHAEWLAEGRQEEAEDEAERRAEYAAEWETEPEWDDADSNAYQARVEVGLEPEAEG
jgi:hypothetical protein